MTNSTQFRSVLRKLSFTALLVFSFTLSFSQSVSTYWKYVNPAPLGNHFVDLTYVNDNVGYACGDAGVIARTTDGGHTWVYDYIPTREALQAIQFVDATTGYAVGFSGRVVKTTNRGITWDTVAVRPLTNVTLNNLYFFDANNGIVVGNVNGSSATIFKTTNGGASWTSLASVFPVQTKNIQGISFINASVGYVSGSSGLVAKTTDGGASWTNISLVAGNPVAIGGAGSLIVQSYPGLGVVDAQTVIISSQNNSYIIKSTDGGTTWVVKGAQTPNASFYIPGSFQMWNMAVKGSDVVVTMGSYVGASHDKGETWTMSKPFSLNSTVNYTPYYCPVITPNNSVKLIGMYGIVTDSVSGGPGWDISYYKSLNYNPVQAMNAFSVSHLDKNNVLVGGTNGQIFKSTDGGVNWIDKTIPEFSPPLYNPVAIIDLKYTAADAAYMAAGNGYVYRSLDGGLTWPDPYAFNTTRGVTGLDFSDANTGWVSATNYSVGTCAVYRTTNGGLAWTIQSSPFTAASQLNAIDFVNNTTGWVVGGPSAKIFKTTDGGINWTAQTAPITNILYSVSFANADTGYACGAGGKVIRTIDGGANWTDISPVGLLGIVNKVLFVNGKTGVVFGTGGACYKTMDAGNTWKYFSAPTNDVLANASLIARYNTTNTPDGPDVDMMVVGGRLIGGLAPSVHTVRVVHGSASVINPIIINVKEKCPNSPAAKGKIMNPPGFTQIDITVDGVPVLYYPNDSSFFYYENGMASGNHTVRVRFTNVAGTVFKDTTYNVFAANLVPLVSISSSDADNIVCEGQPVTFTAIPVNGGLAPFYSWQVNQINVGTNANTYSFTPVNGDRVSVEMRSGFACVTDPFVITFNLPIDVPKFNPVISTTTVNQLTITSPDNTATYQWMRDGQLIAGATGLSYTAVNFGNYSVRETLRTCSKTSNVITIAPQPVAGNDLTVFPVPAVNNLYAQSAGATTLINRVRIFDANGKLLLVRDFSNNNIIELNVSGLSAGVYIAKFETTSGTVIKRFVKQ